MYPHGHYGKRPLQVSREYPASEDQVRVSDGVKVLTENNGPDVFCKAIKEAPPTELFFTPQLRSSWWKRPGCC